MISLIIPVYNVEKYLAECLDSVLGQTYPHWEAVLVDDGSSDASPAICDAYAAGDARFRVIHQENRGLSAARNAGLSAARGEFIAFVDSDDYLTADSLEALVHLQRETGADLCALHLRRLKDSGEFEDLPNPVKGVEVFTGRERMAAYIRDRKMRNAVWAKLYARKLFDEIRFPLGKTSEDLAVMYLLIHAAERVALSDKVGYIYRKREGSLMTRKVSARDFDDLQIREEQQAFIRSHYPELEQYMPAQLFASALMYTVRTAADRFEDREIDRRLQRILRRNLKSHLRRSKNRKRNLIAVLAACNIRLARSFIRAARRIAPGAMNITW